MPYAPGRRKVTGVTGSARRREEGKVISEMAGNFLPRPLLRLRWRIGSGFVRSFEGFLRTVEGGGGPSTGLLVAAPSWLQNGVLPAPYTPLLHVLPPCLGTEALSPAEKTSRQSAPHPLTQTPQPLSDISLLQVKQWLEARHSPSRGRTGETVALIDDHEACCESELASAIALLVEHNCPGVHRLTVCAKPPCVQIFKWPRNT
ncbi:uncharacterized protein LOC109518511 [Hippocampus comes]|uniref:uncharacterized protein LOC109518511 n=1 Tax=Hippocampus comes TaxID=109280 RepID=UPI00094E8232|nr:PREDICTED: uncharacterized protein LOC109518511 [Hippocampus comes]